MVTVGDLNSDGFLEFVYKVASQHGDYAFITFDGNSFAKVDLEASSEFGSTGSKFHLFDVINDGNKDIIVEFDNNGPRRLQCFYSSGNLQFGPVQDLVYGDDWTWNVDGKLSDLNKDGFLDYFQPNDSLCLEQINASVIIENSGNTDGIIRLTLQLDSLNSYLSDDPAPTSFTSSEIV